MQEAAVCCGDKESGVGVINQLLNPISDSRRLGCHPAQISAVCNEWFFFLQFKTVMVRSFSQIITDLKIKKQNTTIRVIALCGCDTCPVVLNRKPRTSINYISGLQEDEVRGLFMTLHKNVPHDMYRILGFIRIVNYKSVTCLGFRVE
jgi:hypothetical protein